MTKITLDDVVNLSNQTTAETTINDNSATIVTAFDNTLSRDGTSPNQMLASLDLNGNRILNLPTPVSQFEPIRLLDANSLEAGGTINVSNLPTGGTTGQFLSKNSSTNFDAGWSSPSTPVGSISGLGTGVSTFLATPNSTNLAFAVTDETGTGPLVFANSPAFTTPALGTPTSGTLTNCSLPVANITGAATGVLAFLATPSSANLRTALTDETGTGAAVFATSPTLVTPVLGIASATTLNGTSISPGHITGEPSNGSANAGEIGEYVESIVVSGSAVSLVTATAKTVTSISLTAGDWDVDLVGYIFPNTTTSVTLVAAGLSTTTNTLDLTPGRFVQVPSTAVVSGGAAVGYSVPPYRLSLSGTTTVFLVVSSNFTVSTAGGYGIIRARRAR